MNLRKLKFVTETEDPKLYDKIIDVENTLKELKILLNKDPNFIKTCKRLLPKKMNTNKIKSEFDLEELLKFASSQQLYYGNTLLQLFDLNNKVSKLIPCIHSFFKYKGIEVLAVSKISDFDNTQARIYSPINYESLSESGKEYYNDLISSGFVPYNGLLIHYNIRFICNHMGKSEARILKKSQNNF